MFGGADKVGLQGTKEWRLQWWDKIYDYTVHGPYFWTGKGFGINLADDDGFQVQQDKSLRSPHSIHMTYLARMGVPGVVLWGFMHLVWFYCIGNAYYRARRRGERSWAGLFQFLFAYYMAFVINGSFDVFIEGPMGGVWFWSIYGAGVGSLWVYRYRPEVLSELTADRNEDSGRAQLLPAAGWRGRGLPLGAGAS
jgi:O-antigen ligase